MRELPRQLTVEELADLFSGQTRFVERLAERDEPLEHALEVARGLPEAEKVEALATHPRIGESSPEQHGNEAAVLTELDELNRAYEEKFGFRFLVFVAGRPRAAIVPILQERLERTREEELETALEQLVAIARDRWTRTT